LDELDPTASEKVPERIKAIYGGHRYTDEDKSENDHSDVSYDYDEDESDDDGDYDEDSYDDEYKVPFLLPFFECCDGDARTQSRDFRFPARRGSLYHPVRSRVHVDTTVAVRLPPIGSLMTGVIRQIIQDPENKERFRYSVEARVSSLLRGILGDQFHY
jgi:hypothetical protein